MDIACQGIRLQHSFVFLFLYIKRNNEDADCNVGVNVSAPILNTFALCKSSINKFENQHVDHIIITKPKWGTQELNLVIFGNKVNLHIDVKVCMESCKWLAT